MPDLCDYVFVDRELYCWDAAIDDFVRVSFERVTVEPVRSDQTRAKVAAAIMKRHHGKSAEK